MKSTSSVRREPPVPSWMPTRTTARVVIPAVCGKGITYTLDHEVDAWRDPQTGETYLDGYAVEELARIKARCMGILAPEELKAIRQALELSQKELSALLQIGEKTWTRWETGRERPSRSMNVLLRALKDGRIDAGYLRTLRSPQPPVDPDYAHTRQPVPALMVCESATPARPKRPVATRKAALRARRART